MACAYSLASAAARQDSGLGQAERDQLVERYAARAIDLLRQAIEKGFKDAKHMKKDTDLIPLRSRDDFQGVLQELEAKAKPGGHWPWMGIDSTIR